MSKEKKSGAEGIWKKLTAKIPENVLTSILLLVLGAVLLGVFYVPQKIEEHQCKQFAKPLFEHFLPKNSYAVQTSSVRDDNGGTTAAIILGTEDELSEEILYTFYSDGAYLPAQEGDVVELAVKALDDASISALRQAGLYRDGDDYYFVYIYSAKAE